MTLFSMTILIHASFLFISCVQKGKIDFFGLTKYISTQCLQPLYTHCIQIFYTILHYSVKTQTGKPSLYFQLLLLTGHK